MRDEFFAKLVSCYLDFFHDRLISIVLFGSRARVDSNPMSDYDIFIIADGLPYNPLKRLFLLRQPITARFEERVCIISKTPEEFEKGFPSLYLDIALDGRILYDKNNYFGEKREIIVKIIEEAGLVRRRVGRDFSWDWIRPPKDGWAIDWSGFHALSK